MTESFLIQPAIFVSAMKLKNINSLNGYIINYIALSFIVKNVE